MKNYERKDQQRSQLKAWREEGTENLTRKDRTNKEYLLLHNQKIKTTEVNIRGQHMPATVWEKARQELSTRESTSPAQPHSTWARQARHMQRSQLYPLWTPDQNIKLIVMKHICNQGSESSCRSRSCLLVAMQDHSNITVQKVCRSRPESKSAMA